MRINSYFRVEKILFKSNFCVNYLQHFRIVPMCTLRMGTLLSGSFTGSQADVLIRLGSDYLDMPGTSNYARVDGGYESLAESVILFTFLLPSALLMWSYNLYYILYS